MKNSEVPIREIADVPTLTAIVAAHALVRAGLHRRDDAAFIIDGSYMAHVALDGDAMLLRARTLTAREKQELAKLDSDAAGAHEMTKDGFIGIDKIKAVRFDRAYIDRVLKMRARSLH